MLGAPENRVRTCCNAPVAADGDYVVYWMMAARRTGWNYGLQQAVHYAQELGRPLVVFEAIRCGYRWASDRFHQFVLEGMRDRAQWFAGRPVTYVPYVEPREGAGRGLLEHLAGRACVVVTDDYPAFFLPRAVSAVASRLKVRLEAVDSNGIFPMRATERVFTTAYSFRSFLQKELPARLDEWPSADPLADVPLPRLGADPLVNTEWRAHDVSAPIASVIAGLPIDHGVGGVAISGCAASAEAATDRFFAGRLARYATHRNDPEDEGASGLSPYLHFGAVSAHALVRRVLDDASWTPARLGEDTRGARRGWWGLPEAHEAFLDQVITWRELGFNMCAHRPDDYDKYGSLPSWARRTLEDHARDARPHLYPLEVLERAETHDEIWNAAQRQLVRDGTMHNYLRMLWAKKVLEWSPSPEVTLERLLHLNNRWALDGRDPNSTSGIFWTLGRYDRAWGPERPIFGKVRYMSSDSTKRKLRLRGYLARYSARPSAVSGDQRALEY